MTQLETLHGHLRRSAKAQDKRKQALQHTKEMCQHAWNAFIKEHQSPEVITDEQINGLYEALYDDIEKSVSAHLIPFALFERKRFFDNINEARKKRHLL